MNSSQQKKCRGCRCRLSDNLCEKIFPADHAADVSHQLRSSGRFRRPLAPSCETTGKIGQIKLSHIRKNPGAGLVRASLARLPTDCDTCGNLRRRGVGVFDTPTSGDACEGVCQTHQPPNHRGNFSERPERHEGPVRARCESTTPLVLSRPASRSGRFIEGDGRFIKAGQPQ